MQLAEMYYRRVRKLFFKAYPAFSDLLDNNKTTNIFYLQFPPYKTCVNMIKIPMEIWDCINTISSGL